MALLPSIGTVTYNGYTFNSTVGSSIRGMPVYDEAGRTVTHVVYTLHLRASVFETAPGGGADAVVEDLRTRLTTAGQSLTFTSKGFGSFTINAAGAKDVVWGPKPRLIALEPIGSAAAWRLEWSCEVAVPECTSATYAFGVMAFNYETSYSIDADGYTTRSYSGYLEIPMTRAGGGRSLPDHVGNYRERIQIPIPLGFKRIRREFSESKDKRRLDFHIQDEELPLYGQVVGCTSAGGDFTVETGQGIALQQFNTSIHASYTVAKDQPLTRAYEAFYALYADRVNQTNSRVGSDGQAIASHFRVSMGLYEQGRQISFEISYFYLSSIERILTDSGIWRPVPKTDGTQWAASVAIANGNRGLAGLRSSAAEDAIIDLCQSSSTRTLAGSFGGSRDLRAGGDPSGFQSPQAMRAIDFKIALETVNDAGTVITSTLRTDKTNATNTLQTNPTNVAPMQATLTTRAAKDWSQAASNNVIPAADNRQVTPDRPITDIPAPTPQTNGIAVQNRTVDTTRIRLCGYAVTTWAPLTCPGLIRYGQFDLVPEMKNVYRTAFIGTIGGLPVYSAVWDLWYRVVPRKGQKIPSAQLGKNIRVREFIPPSIRGVSARIDDLRRQFDGVFNDVPW